MVRIKRKQVAFSFKAKRFADSIYGGKERAKEAALSYHAKLLKELPAPFSNPRRPSFRKGTGKARIYLRKNRGRKGKSSDSCTYYSWAAAWIDEKGRRIKHEFACKKYGPNVARTLAFIARNHRLGSQNKDKVFEFYNESLRQSSVKG
jgi:hypothetical protein